MCFFFHPSASCDTPCSSSHGKLASWAFLPLSLPFFVLCRAYLPLNSNGSMFQTSVYNLQHIITLLRWCSLYRPIFVANYFAYWCILSTCYIFKPRLVHEQILVFWWRLTFLKMDSIIQEIQIQPIQRVFFWGDVGCLFFLYSLFMCCFAYFPNLSGNINWSKWTAHILCFICSFTKNEDRSLTFQLIFEGGVYLLS